jgi:RNA-directed DNA polymerase|nr:reverse transcriptase domain-containing protein [Neorhizobium tomejilense]
MKTAREVFVDNFAVDKLKAVFEERLAHGSTVGKDGIHPLAFQKNLDQEIGLIRKNTFAGVYKFTTFKQRLISKGADVKPREISIAGVRDRLTLRALNNTLLQIFPEAKQPLPHHFIREIKAFIAPLDDAYSFLQLDVKEFYPTLVHGELLKRLRSRTRHKPLLALVASAIRTPTGSKKLNERGVPQGLSISNVLSSIYMMKIDDVASSEFQYCRYVDDILIICRTENAKRNHEEMEKRLAKVGLTVHPLQPGSKTKINLLSEGVDYLGYNITPSMIAVRRSSYRRMMENIMGVMTSAKYKPSTKKIMLRLNLKVTGCIMNGKRYGWMFFFSMTEDTKQLRRLDRFVSRLWRRYDMEKYGKPKTFVKTYHEIKFNSAATKYIPKYDDFTIKQKMQLIADLEGLDLEDVKNWTEEKINKTFRRLVKREISELEKDITPVS